MKLKQYLISILAIIIIQSGSALALFREVELDIMEQHFKNFEYEEVIAIADQVIIDKDLLTPEQLVTVYKLRALANYSLLQMDISLKDFLEILKIDPDFSLDPITTSPKIVTFFNEIKSSLRSYEAAPELKETKTDTVRLVSDHSMLLRNMMVRSMILPGWGHLHYRKSEKGFVLFTIGFASMAGSTYYMLECYHEQKEYLNATNPDVIAKKYSIYNKAYKNRSLFLTAYALVWLYSQTDIMFSQSKKITSGVKVSIMPMLQSQATPGICCSLHF